MRRFIANYNENFKVFMCLLKQDALFIWDEQAQLSFDAVKQSVVSTSVLSPFDYTREFWLYLAETESTREFLLYLAETESTLRMVLV